MSRDSWQAVRAVFLAAIMVISVFAAGVAFSGSAAAQTAAEADLVVDADFKSPDQETNFSSIQTAVNNANEGDIIVVQSGTYQESITVDVTDLTLEAADGASPTVSVAPGSASGTSTIDIQADGVTVSGLTVERVAASNRESTGSGYAQGIAVRSSNVTVENNDVVGDLSATSNKFDRFSGIVVIDPSDAGTTENVDVLNNDVSGFDTGVLVTTFYGGSVSDVTINNTDATDNRIGFAAKIHKADGSISGVSGSGNEFTGSDEESIVFSPESFQGFSGLQSIPTTAVNFDGPVLVEDGDSIQTAVNVAGDGATVSVGSGVYREQVVISSRSDVTISGEGDSTTIESPENTDINPIGLEENSARDPEILNRSIRTPVAVLGSSSIELSDIQVDGRNQGAGGQAFFGIYVENSSGSIVGTSVVNATLGGDSSPTGNPFTDAIRVQNSDDEDRQFVIEDVSVEKFDKRGIAAQSVGDGNLSVEVTGSTVIGAGPTDETAQNGISLTGVSATVTDNTIVNLSYTKDGANSGYISTARISDSEFTDNTLRDEVPSEGAPVGIFLTGSDNVTFAGNTIEGTAFGIFPNSGASDTEIESNTLRGQDTAILLSGSDDESIQSNTFKNNTRHLQDFDTKPDLQELVADNTFDRVVTIEDDAGNLNSSSIFGAIQPAVDEASPGDTVNASSGIYNESVEISTPNVTVSGAGDPRSSVDTTIEGLVTVSAQEAELRTVIVAPPTFDSDSESQAVLVTASEATVDDVIVDISVEVTEPDGFFEAQAIQVFASDSEPISDVVISDNIVIGDATQSNDALVGVSGISDQGNTTDTLIVNNDIDVTSEGYSFGVVTRASGGSNAVGTPSSEVLFNDITATGGTLNGVGYGIESTSNDGAGSNGAQVDAEDQQVKYNKFENIDSIEHKAADGRLDLSVNSWEDPGDVQFLTDAFDSDIQDGGEIVYDPVLTEEKSVNQFDELVTENENGEIFATTRDYGSYIELETEGEPAVIGFPAPPAEPLGELISNETLQVEGEGAQIFLYDNAAQSFEEVDGSFVPEAGDVIVITTGGDPISGDFVVPVDTTVEGIAADPNSGTVDVNEGWNLVATGAANSLEAPTTTSNLLTAGQFQTQPAQPGAPTTTVGAYDGTWLFVDEDGQLTTGYVEDQLPFAYGDLVLTPETESNDNDS